MTPTATLHFVPRYGMWRLDVIGYWLGHGSLGFRHRHLALQFAARRGIRLEES